MKPEMAAGAKLTTRRRRSILWSLIGVPKRIQHSILPFTKWSSTSVSALMTRPSRLCRHPRKTRAEALIVREHPHAKGA